LRGENLGAEKGSAGDVSGLENGEREEDLIETVDESEEFGFCDWIL
jgi:hypothetical protein